MVYSSAMLRIPQYFRNIQRLGEIAGVLVKHGFGDVVQRLELPHYLSGLRGFFTPGNDEDAPYYTIGVRLRCVCEELGPTFIKLAQVVAMRPDLFPESIIEEFRKLQDNAAPVPLNAIIARIEDELKQPINEVFSSFEELPLGSASIAQVHRATLRNGDEVVVKVQRPNLDRITETDLDILLGIATLLEQQIPETVSYTPRKLVQEFARTMKQERNFLREGKNLRQFAAQIAEDELIVVPLLYPALSTRRVLVQSYVEGERIDQIISSSNHQGANASYKHRQALLAALNKSVLRAVFEVGFFHGDPHPGNVLLTPDGQIALIDFGAMGRLDATRQIQIIEFLLAAFDHNHAGMIRLLKENLVTPLALDEVSLRTQFAEVIDAHLHGHTPREGINLTALISDIFDVARRYGIRPPPELLLVGRVLTSIQTIATALDPACDPIAMVKPYLINRYREVITSPNTYLKFAREVAHSYQHLLHDAPDDIRTIIKRMARGQFSIGHTQENFAEIARHQNRLFNRALLTIIGIALLFTAPQFSSSSTASWLCIALGGLAIGRVLLAIRRAGGI